MQGRLHRALSNVWQESRIAMKLSFRRQSWSLLAFAFIARLLTLGFYPLTDNTEARYAEIARKMLETGHWIVPQIDYGVPFWGKPPLSFWLTALSFNAIGLSEFAARLPSFLLGVATCALVYGLGSRQRDSNHGLLASGVVATTLLMMVCAGGVMTDPAMMFGTTLSMVAFWCALTTGTRWWGYLFFIGLAVGLLSKGPVATVLTLGPIGVWVLLTSRVREVWRCLPWITGTLLTAALTIPWYWAAEVQSPGFLHYFIVGEHWQRYTVSGWKGDLYGSGHAFPIGMIWVFALLGTLPWSPWLVWTLVRRKTAIAIRPFGTGDGWSLYLLCWMLAPAVFFTMSRNILPTYVLPGLVGFGLLVAEAWLPTESQDRPRRALWMGAVTPVLAILLVFVVWPRVGFQSQKEIISAYSQTPQKGAPLIYFGQRPYSAEFYSRGHAGATDDAEQLRRYINQPKPTFVAAGPTAYARLPADVKATLTRVAMSRIGKYGLYLHQ
jgi:4-amino-4-deoxy-L-arabinose transferase-like glycosyltransferase